MARLASWSSTGKWIGESQLSIGLAASMTSLLDFMMWRALGAPQPHSLFFDIMAAVPFQEPMDRRPYFSSLGESCRRNAWMVHLPPNAALQLQNTVVNDGIGKNVAAVLAEWGFTVSVRSIRSCLPSRTWVLAAHGVWSVLAELPRCTAELLRRQKGQQIDKRK
eukprot:1755645-Amphidinium_carterae.1